MMTLLIGIGGSIGAAARYVLGQWINQFLLFPFGTCLINIFGSFMLGVFMQYYVSESITVGWWLFLGVGVCGGFTTFSTFGLEAVSLIEKKKWVLLILYVVVSVIISICSAWFGYMLYKL